MNKIAAAFCFVLGCACGMLVTLAASEHGQHIRELDAAAEGARAMIIRCTAPEGSVKP